MRRAVVIYNPTAGRRRHSGRLAGILEALRAGGYEAEPRPTERRGHAIELARDAARSNDVVFAYGGDGTIREVATGLYGSDTALGVLPGGTTNVVAIAFGIPFDPVLAARRLCEVRPRPVDVGLCGTHPFLMGASSGFEAYLMARLNPLLKARLGFSGPVLQSLGMIWRYDFAPIDLRVDGFRTSATGAMVCNIPEAAGPYRMVEHGKFDDGQLELLTFHGTSVAAFVSLCIDLYRGRLARRKDVESRPVREVVLQGPPGAHVQIDGDVVTDPLPLTVRLAERRLMALVAAP